MTATASPATYRVDMSDADPIIDAWTVEDLTSGWFAGTIYDPEIIGYYIRLEWGEDQCWNPVYPGDACDLYAKALLTCDEDGAWF